MTARRVAVAVTRKVGFLLGTQIVEECEERLGDEGIQLLLDAVQAHLR